MLLDFTSHLEPEPGAPPTGEGPWARLFNALAAQPGWGPKTSALFVKNAIEVHRGPEKLHFLQDASVAAAPLMSDLVRLPVDTVITYIFQIIGLKNANFQSVNKALLKDYSAEDFLVWDDLWYWGFFTQVTSGSAANRKRSLGWNSDKFWCQPAAPRGKEREIRRLGEEFIEICRRR